MWGCVSHGPRLACVVNVVVPEAGVHGDVEAGPVLALHEALLVVQQALPPLDTQALHHGYGWLEATQGVLLSQTCEAEAAVHYAVTQLSNNLAST